jgi:lysophospholipase L1-like esterase
MLLGFALILAGIVVAGLGVRMALERPRPLNLAGMLLAPLGLCIALLGVGRALSPSFFGRSTSAAGGALRIMPAGDSLTVGAIGVDSDGGGYRGPLWKRLEEGKRPVDFVGAARSGPFAIDRDCEAWDGVTVDELAGRLFRDLPAQAPDVILLHVGTNDVIQRASPDVIAGRLAALIDGVTARAPRTHLLVASLAGVRATNAYRVAPESITAANARLRAAVAERAARGARVRFVDVHARVGRTASHFAPDGLHLHERGHGEMAQVWWEALQPLLPPPRVD